MEARNLRTINEKEFFALSGPRERIAFLLRYAVLAPSTHNYQPWLFRVTGNSCEIYYNPDKLIIEADPLGRDKYISFGCLIETLVSAARCFGVFDRVSVAEKNEHNLIAEVFFKNLSVSSPPEKSESRILQAITKRVNARGIFEKKAVPEEVLREFEASNDFQELTLHLISDTERIKKFAELTGEGLRMAYRKESFRKEMSRWIHSSASRKKEGIPGYSLRMPFLLSFIFPLLVRYINIGKMVSKLNYRSIVSAPLAVLITSPASEPRAWLDTGRLAMRLMLISEMRGLHMSIFVAAVEMGDLYKKVQEILGTAEIPHLFMCAGFMDSVQKPNMRHPAESKIIS